jgi:16S rRNA processing protein RimM
MRPTTSTEYDVQVGHILGPHGLRGLVRVLPMTDVPDRHRTLKQVLARTARTEQSLTITQAEISHKGLWLVRFEGIEDRTAAEKLQGADLFIRDCDLPPLPEGQYYVHQIIGLHVRTVAGRDLGPVTEVLATGANDVYVTAAGLLPATDEVVKEINLPAGTMLVDPLPGMLDDPALDGPQDAD